MAFRYTNVQYCEMVRTLARCNDNVTLAVKSYREQFGGSVSRRTMFGVTQRLRDYGTFRPADRVGYVRDAKRRVTDDRPDTPDLDILDSFFDPEHQTEEPKKLPKRTAAKPTNTTHSKKARQASSDDDDDEDDGDSSDEHEEEEPKKLPKRTAAKLTNTTRFKKDPLQASSDDNDDDSSDSEHKGGGGRDDGSTARAYKLSPALADLMGANEMPHQEVVKRMWAIIKENQLYDPNNKQFTICDDALYKVIGIKRFRTFGMMKYLKAHFIDE